jgi:hypothetical protein
LVDLAVVQRRRRRRRRRRKMDVGPRCRGDEVLEPPERSVGVLQLRFPPVAQHIAHELQLLGDHDLVGLRQHDPRLVRMGEEGCHVCRTGRGDEVVRVSSRREGRRVQRDRGRRAVRGRLGVGEGVMRMLLRVLLWVVVMLLVMVLLGKGGLSLLLLLVRWMWLMLLAVPLFPVFVDVVVEIIHLRGAGASGCPALTLCWSMVRMGFV